MILRLNILMIGVVIKLSDLNILIWFLLLLLSISKTIYLLFLRE